MTNEFQKAWELPETVMLPISVHDWLCNHCEKESLDSCEIIEVALTIYIRVIKKIEKSQQTVEELQAMIDSEWRDYELL